MTRAAPHAVLFEDILDGYFPLGESLRQGMDRQGFDAALFVLIQAPLLHLEDRPDSAPVPLRLEEHRSGLIRRLMVTVRREAQGIALRGVGDWIWHDGLNDRPVTPHTRLAEPVFVRGIGLAGQPAPQETLWQIDTVEGSEDWGVVTPGRGLFRRADSAGCHVYAGAVSSGTGSAFEVGFIPSLAPLAGDWGGLS